MNMTRQLSSTQLLERTWSCGSDCRFATVKAHTGAALWSTELTAAADIMELPLLPLAPLPTPTPLGALGILTVQPSPVSDPNMMCWFGRLDMVVGVAPGWKPVSCKTQGVYHAAPLLPCKLLPGLLNTSFCPVIPLWYPLYAVNYPVTPHKLLPGLLYSVRYLVIRCKLSAFRL